MAEVDAELLHQARSGDQEAFAMLLDRQIVAVRRFLYRLGVPAGDLDDLAQEALLTVIRTMPRYRATSSVRTWVLGIALNIVRAARRARRLARVAAIQSLDGTDLEDPHVVLANAESRALIGHAIARLPPLLREAFVLRHVEDLPPKEVAVVLGVPEGTARSRVFEARKLLQALLQAKEVR